jgi:ankyrin repeat protein
VKAHSDGRTPLHSAVLTNALAAIRILLQYEHDNELSLAPDGKGRTPLHCAAFLGYVDALQLLADDVNRLCCWCARVCVCV